MPAHADQSTLWISHVLRREAEAMILSNLQAFLRGEYQPQDNDERLALLGICQAQGLCAAAARLFADAFASDPRLADRMMRDCLRLAVDDHESRFDPNPNFGLACRYAAARCAALAGCGQGKVAEKLSDVERAHWRKQAREWLQADLKIWIAKLNSDLPMEQSLAKRVLTNWQTDSDLAGLREPDALDPLSAEEQRDCLAMWREVRLALRPRAGHGETAALDPKRSGSVRPPPQVLMRLGRLEAARSVWKSVVEAYPLEHGTWHGYAELCLFLGEDDEYRRVTRALLERFGATTDPYVAERISRACLLKPAAGDELRQAVALAARAVAANPGEQAAEPYFRFARGLAQYRQGEFEQALAAMRGVPDYVIGPAPGLVLAMALCRKGQTAPARQALASAVLAHDWRANQVLDVHACIIQVLRREAESMILPNLPAFLDGKYRPDDNAERLGLLGACQFTNRTCAMARLYSEAFAADPRLAEDLRAGHRFNAARAAALSGCGIGLDGAKLGVEERTAWRRQARDWLRADLAALTQLINSKRADSRDRVRESLARWNVEPDLAGLREPSGVGALSTDERNECRALWQAVDDLLKRARQEK
jgi:tetratricopeptide (TPR) repeat protein